MRCFDKKNCARIQKNYSKYRKRKLIITYLANNSKSTSSLSIQPHVFSIRLSKANIMAILKKLPYGKGITIHITRGKALICHIEKGIKFFVFYYLGQLLPLFFAWVHTSWVMGAGVQQDNAVFRDFLKKESVQTKKTCQMTESKTSQSYLTGTLWSHWSTPVGFWAQACNRTMLLSVISWKLNSSKYNISKKFESLFIDSSLFKSNW